MKNIVLHAHVLFYPELRDVAEQQSRVYSALRSCARGRPRVAVARTKLTWNGTRDQKTRVQATATINYTEWHKILAADP